MEMKWFFIAAIALIICTTAASILAPNTTKSAWQIKQEQEMEKWRANVIKADSTVEIDSCIYRVTKIQCK